MPYSLITGVPELGSVQVFYHPIGERCNVFLFKEELCNDFFREKCCRIPTKRYGSAEIQDKTCLVMENGTDVSREAMMQMLDYTFYNLPSEFGKRKKTKLDLPVSSRFAMRAEYVEMQVQQRAMVSRSFPTGKGSLYLAVTFQALNDVDKTIQRYVKAALEKLLEKKPEFYVYNIVHLNPAFK